MYNVKKVQRPSGAIFLYFRPVGGGRLTRLQSALPEAWEGSPLKAEVDGLLASKKGQASGPTLADAIRRYKTDDPDYAVLAPSTKGLYQVALRQMTKQLGRTPVSDFKPAFIDELRNRWAKQGHRAANVRLQVLKNVLRPSVIAGRIKGGDPFTMIRGVRRPRDLPEPHVIWSDDTVDVLIRHAVETKWFGVARAIALGRYAGLRLGDMVQITQSSRQAGRLLFMSGKRRIQVDMAEDSRLTELLDRTPDAQSGTTRSKAPGQRAQTTIVYNRRGRPYSANGLGQAFRTVVGTAFKAKLVPSDRYSAHGLRHTFGVELALAGVTDAEGAALMGHGSPHSFVTYRRQADQKSLSDAGQKKVREGQKNPFRKPDSDRNVV